MPRSAGAAPCYAVSPLLFHRRPDRLLPHDPFFFFSYQRAFVFNASVAAVQVLFLLWTTSQLLFLPTPKVTIDLDV